MMKKCNKCGVEKPLDGFDRHPNGSFGRRGDCKPCRLAYQREWEKGWRAANPEKRRVRERRHCLGIGTTVEDERRVVAKQGGDCAICQRSLDRHNFQFTPHLDHDHATGKPRGFLCGTCNRALGMFKDSALVLERAAIYLRNGGIYA